MVVQVWLATCGMICRRTFEHLVLLFRKAPSDWKSYDPRGVRPLYLLTGRAYVWKICPDGNTVRQAPFKRLSAGRILHAMKRYLPILVLALSLAAQAQGIWTPDLRSPSPRDEKRMTEVQEIGLQWWFQHHGVLAEESFKVAGSFITARPIAQFSERDDRIWELRVLHLHTGGPSGILWVNDKTGKVIAMGGPTQSRSSEAPAGAPR